MDRSIALTKAIAQQFISGRGSWTTGEDDDEYTLSRVEDNKIFIQRECESDDEIYCEEFMIEVTPTRQITLPRWLP